jgi:hypothetical protein
VVTIADYLFHHAATEFDSDIRAVLVDRCVAVTPLSLNLTSPVNFDMLALSLQFEATLDRGSWRPLVSLGQPVYSL